MFWNKLLSLFFSGTVVMAHTVPLVLQPKPQMEELLSYDCAHSVASLYTGDQPTGPLFTREGLVFTSLVSTDQKRLLVLSTGSGTYKVTLPSIGINRIRFLLPGLGSSIAQPYFLSYMHDEVFRSRVFEFGYQRPPSGHDELEYHLVEAQRAEYLLPHLEYAIFETAENVVTALAQGRISRSQIQLASATKCEHLSRHSPSLQASIRHNIDALDMMVVGPRKSANRAPASLGLPKVKRR